MDERIPLTPKMVEFVAQSMHDMNAPNALKRMGVEHEGRYGQARLYMMHPGVRAAIDREIRGKVSRTNGTPESILQKWLDIVNADPADLVQQRVKPCRYCHGKDHQYQWKTRREYEAACREAVIGWRGKFKAAEQSEITDEMAEMAGVLPSCAGGFGYRQTVGTNPDCPECDGEGEGYVLFSDVRDLTPAQRALYGGVKQTKDGTHVVMHDQASALTNVARHLGMFIDKTEVTVNTSLAMRLEAARARMLKGPDSQ